MIHLRKNKAELSSYLKGQKFLESGEELISLEVPGAGNMNFTLRITTNQRSFIIKQSRAYVEKYPQVAAPADRSLREAEFYEAIHDDKFLKEMTPELMAEDRENNIIIMEDLGVGSDFTYLYKAEDTIENEDLKEIISFAAHLHVRNKVADAKNVITNRAMRKLNHEHIFIYPYAKDNGLDLDAILPGLKEESSKYKSDQKLLKKVGALGERYLEYGDTLLHGDYFPGSWLKTKNGIKVIDPEFCFYGYPEFEIGVTTAHLMMADQALETVFNAFKYYTEIQELDLELCRKCAGVEIMRRILGLAQLPLAIDLEKRAQLLETAREYVVT